MRGRGNNDRRLMRKLSVVTIDDGVADLISTPGLRQRDDRAADSAAGESGTVDTAY